MCVIRLWRYGISVFISRNSNYSDIRYYTHVRICTDILRKINRNDSSVKRRHSSSFEFPARNIITRRTWHAVLHPFSKLSFAVDHAGERHIHVPYIYIYTHTQNATHKGETRTRIRYVALIIEKRTTEFARLENCGPSSRRCILVVESAREGGAGREANERVLRKSSSGERLSRQVSCSTLRATARFPRARHENASWTLTGSAARLCVCATHIYIHIYICTYCGSLRNLFAINLVRNRTRYRESNSVPVPKKYESRLGRNARNLANVNFLKRAKWIDLVEYIHIRT